MAYPWFTIATWLIVTLVALLGIAGTVSAGRLRSLSLAARTGLVVVIWTAMLAAIGWLIFVAPVYVD